MPDLLIIDGDTVKRVLTAGACIEVMRSAMTALSSGNASIPPRLSAPAFDGDGSLLVMPGAALGLPAYGAKFISLHPGNSATNLPVIQGFVALFDHETGTPRAIIDAASLTAIRTAAASGLASEVLARPDVKSHGILGTGVQARSHAEAICAARPSIEETMIWGRDPDKAKAAAADISKATSIEVRPVADIDDVIRCDVISAVTGAKTPLIEGSKLREGSHLNLVGAHTPDAREADTAAITRSKVYVDSKESALREAGDLLLPIEEGAWSAEQIAGEIGEVICGNAPGRKGEADITLYKSLGNAVQDLLATCAVMDLAQDKGLGHRVTI